MKNIILILLAFIGLVSCKDNNNMEMKPPRYNLTYTIDNGRGKTDTITLYDVTYYEYTDERNIGANIRCYTISYSKSDMKNESMIKSARDKIKVISYVLVK